MNIPIIASDGVFDLVPRKGVSFVEKFGRNSRISSGTSEDIWDGGVIYDFPDIATKADVSSTSAEDGAGTLTGALSIGIQGLDENYDLVEEKLTLNGTTVVETANTYIRIFRAAVRTAGSSGNNIGVISLESQSEVITIAQISEGIGQTNMALYTIPNGYTGYLKKWYTSIMRATGTNAVAADIDMFRRNIDLANAWKSTHPIGIQNSGSGNFEYEYTSPLKLPAKSDIVVNAIPTAVADISAGFSIILINEIH